MKYLLDTDISVYWLRGHDDLRSHIVTIEPNSIAISAMTLAELQYGAECSNKPKENHEAINKMAGNLTVIDIGPSITRQFATIKNDLRSKGQLIEDADLLIAATAVAYSLTLVTNNTKHFNRVINLEIENWMTQNNSDS